MKNKKAFTLIELLAVIIILGVLMIIAVPSVTEYIQQSRKSSYITTIHQYISGASKKINAAETPMFDVDTTYYLPTSCIALEKGNGVTPFGDIEEGYVIVTYDGFKFDYYFTIRGSSKQGIPITSQSKLKNESILTGVKEIDTTIGIEGKNKIKIITDCGEQGEETEPISIIPVGSDYTQKKEYVFVLTPKYRNAYRCEIEGEVGIIFFEENGSVMTILESEGTIHSEDNVVSYYGNKILFNENEETFGLVSNHGNTIEFNESGMMMTCNLDESSIKLNKPYKVNVSDSYTITFLVDGSATIAEYDNLLAFEKGTFYYSKNYLISKQLGAFPILENGKKININGTILTLVE